MIPVLELPTGEKMAQSDAILRHVGREVGRWSSKKLLPCVLIVAQGLYPIKDTMKTFRIDMLLGLCHDMHQAIVTTVNEEVGFGTALVFVLCSHLASEQGLQDNHAREAGQ